MTALNETHDGSLSSWVEAANRRDTDFPVQNLPFGIFRRDGGGARAGVAIGDQILDLGAALEAGIFAGPAEAAARTAAGPTLNGLMALGNVPCSALRAALSDFLSGAAPAAATAEAVLLPMAEATLELPAAIGSFTDFLCAYHHTRRLSPTGEAPPAFKSLPIAYHSRATSVRPSATDVIRPHGQFLDPDGELRFAPEAALDFELELGAFIGPGNDLGQPIPIAAAADHLFGFCLLNDWSSRGVQRWESQPLGPFLAKSFLTSISPWVVTAEAMAPFRAPAHARDAGDAPPPHLSAAADQAGGGMDLALEAYVLSEKMRGEGRAPERLTATTFLNCYWTFAQMLSHHTSNGCNLQPGDLLGSGTLSGPDDASRACLAELTKRGSEPLVLESGESRPWLEDGDEIIFRARAERQGFVAIGFGECRGRVRPAVPWPAAAGL